MKKLILISALLFSAMTFAGGTQGGGVGRLAVSFNNAMGSMVSDLSDALPNHQGVFVYFVRATDSMISFVVVSNFNGVVISKETIVTINDLSKYPVLDRGLTTSKNYGAFAKSY